MRSGRKYLFPIFVVVMCVSLAAPASYDVEVQADNPLIWFKFEVDDIGGNVSVTNSASGPNAITVDANYVGPDPFFAPGKVGKGVFLHGKGDKPGECIAIFSKAYTGGSDYSHSYALTPGDMTIELWFKSRPNEEYGEGGPHGWARLFSNNGTYSIIEAGRAHITDRQYSIVAGSLQTDDRDCPYFYFEDPNYDPNAPDPNDTGPGDGDWHHMVYTFDCNDANPDEPPLTLQLYLDGALLGSVFLEPNTTLQSTGVLGPEYRQFLIGAEANTDNLYNCLRGTMDEFAVYDYVLPPGRVAVHYSEGLAAAGWTPESCEQIYRYDWGMPADVSGDCYVSFEDIVNVGNDWWQCVMPQDTDPTCDNLWL